MALDTFWQSIDLALDTIAADQARTFESVKTILNAHGDPAPYGRGERGANASFFAGSGADRQLIDSLRASGWRIVWAEASYYYVATHPDTGETLTYCEGDVMRGDTTGRAL